MMVEKELVSPHGTLGTISSINGNILMVRGQNNIEKSIIATTSTSIRHDNDEKTVSDLHASDTVIIFGVPIDDGQIEAKLIRILPSPPSHPL